MTEAQRQRFKLCQERAAAIVSAYRNEAPEGCDPKATWVAIGAVAVGTAVSAGGTYMANKKSANAAKQAAGVKYNTTPELLDDPAKISASQVLQNLYSANTKNWGNAAQQARSVNKFNYNQALRYYNQMLPGFNQLQQQIGTNANSFARGELPGDVQSAITRAAAQQGIQGGYGFGSGGASQGALGNLNLRNLGLTSLDLSKYGTNLGMQASQNAKSLLPNMTGLQDFWLSPNQALGIRQQNVAATNQFAIQNNQLQNNAVAAQNQQLYNQTQGNYAAQLQQAQAMGQAAQQVGGLISGLGTSGALGGTSTPSYSSQGLGVNQFMANNNAARLA